MASSPSIPDPNQAAIAGIKADVKNFPFEYMVNSAAQQGSPITINGQTYDFTGQGNADQAAAATSAQDQAQLDIQNQYGPAYIQQALANLQQSNPTGYAARQQLAGNIISDAQNPVISPAAQQTQDQVESMLQNAGQLDPQALQQVQQGVRGQQVNSGITLGNAPANQEADAVLNASDSLRAQQQNAAEQYLASGVSPEDVTYRQIQQSLSNLGAFVNNQTPEAQFAGLSGAQNGAAPNNAPNFSNPASIDPNAAQEGINFSNQSYATAQQNGNPWLQGLSIAATGANSVSNSLSGTNFNFGGNSITQPQTNNIQDEFNGIGAPGMTGSGGFSPSTGIQGGVDLPNPGITSGASMAA